MAQYKKTADRVKEELVQRLRKERAAEEDTPVRTESGVSQPRKRTEPQEDSTFAVLAPLSKLNPSDRRNNYVEAYSTGSLQHPDFRGLSEPERTFRRIDYLTRELRGVTVGQRVVAIAIVTALRGHEGRTRIVKNDILPPDIYSVALRSQTIPKLEQIGLLHAKTGSWGTEIELLF